MNNQNISKELMKTTKEVVSDIAELMKTLMGIIRDEKEENNTNAKSLYKHIKEGKDIKSLTVADGEEAILRKYLDKEKVPYVMVDVAGDNCKVIMFKDLDESKVNLAVKCMNIEVNNVVDLSYDEFKAIYKNTDISMLRVNDKLDAELLKDKCIDVGVPHTTIIDKGSYVFFFPKNKAEEFGRAVGEVTWEKTGENSRYYKQMALETLAAYSFSTMTRQEMEKQIKARDGAFYIVDYNNSNNYVKIMERNMEIYKDNVLVKSDSLSELEKSIAMLHNPIILTTEEMKEKEKVLHDKIPELDVKLLQEEKAIKLLYIQKIQSMYTHFNDNSNLDKVLEQLKEEIKDIDCEIENATISQHLKDASKDITKFEYTETTEILDKIIRQAQDRVSRGEETQEISRTYTHSSKTFER